MDALNQTKSNERAATSDSDELRLSKADYYPASSK
jgi:hypothetical protein